MAAHARRRPGASRSIQHAAGLALQSPTAGSRSPIVQDSTQGLFGELDTLLGLGTDRQREHGRALAAELTRTLKGTVQCQEAAAGLLREEGGREGGRQPFAELDGLLRRSDPVVERIAAPRLLPFKKEMEALLVKVSSDSDLLAARHNVEALTRPQQPPESPASSAGRPEASDATEPAQHSAAPGGLFAELDSLLPTAPERHQERCASLSAALKRLQGGAAQGRQQVTELAEQALRGEDGHEDREHEVWRREALEALKGEAPAVRRSASQGALVAPPGRRWTPAVAARRPQHPVRA